MVEERDAHIGAVLAQERLDGVVELGAGVAEHHHHFEMGGCAQQRGGADDNQYYQVYKGRATAPILDALSLPYHWVNSIDDYSVIEDAARQAMLARVPVAVLFSRRAMIGNDKPKG